MEELDDFITDYVSAAVPKQTQNLENFKEPSVVEDVQISDNSFHTIDQKVSAGSGYLLSIGCAFSPSSSSYKPSPVVKYSRDVPLTTTFGYMFQTPFDIMMSLSISIDEKAAMLLRLLPRSAEEPVRWSPVDTVSNEEAIYVYGIVLRSDENVKMDVDSVSLTGSWSNSKGKAVGLHLKNCAFSTFSGQFFAAKGINPTGQMFIVQEILELPLPVRREFRLSTPRSIVFAAGPFTSSDNLEFEQLKELVAKIIDNPPDLLILAGPFLPEKHVLVEKNFVSTTFENMLEVVISKCVLSPIEHLHTKVIIGSSPRDVAHGPVYPAAPFHLGVSDAKCLLAPDPCLIDLDGFTVGWTTTDVLLHLSREEISQSIGLAGSRMSRLCEHLMRQRSFYPLYPPSEDLCVDYGHAEEFCKIDPLPALLLLPSCLRQFAAEVENTFCVNPGYLCKGDSSGTYCRVQIFPSSSSRMADMTAAEIIKL